MNTNDANAMAKWISLLWPALNPEQLREAAKVLHRSPIDVPELEIVLEAMYRDDSTFISLSEMQRRITEYRTQGTDPRTLTNSAESQSERRNASREAWLEDAAEY